jgi:hypothetical protein
MKFLLALAVAFLFVVGPLTPLAGEAGESGYDALLAELKSGNTAIDFRALRYARAEQPGYNPYGALADPDKGDMLRAMTAGNVDRVATLAELIIERDYTDVDAHAALALVLERRGMTEQAVFERAVADGLLRSIQESGDGTTPETAYVVISVAEEYSLLGASGVQVAKQSLLQTARGPVDALEVVNRANGERRTVYFDVSRLFAAMQRLGQAQKAP